jgi:hypothetical protein
MEQEVARAAVAMTRATKKDAGGRKAEHARRIDPAHAWLVLCEAVRGMTSVEARERLVSDSELLRMAWAVPEVRARYHKLMKKEADKAGK